MVDDKFQVLGTDPTYSEVNIQPRARPAQDITKNQKMKYKPIVSDILTKTLDWNFDRPVGFLDIFSDIYICKVMREFLESVVDSR